MSSSRSVVESFYRDALSSPASPELTERLSQLLAPGWTSVGDYSGAKKSREQFGAQLQGFGQLMPDLTWKIEEVIEAGDRFVVRSRASGTPRGELFGVPPSGRRFEIMTVDIHTVENGRIASTYHVEDWAGAIRQLKG